MSWHSILHNAVGTVAFLSLIVACFLLARLLSVVSGRGWAAAGRASAVLFLAGMAWAFGGGKGGGLTLFLGVSLAWLWLSISMGRLAGSALFSPRVRQGASTS